jgi:hypothetical protein
MAGYQEDGMEMIMAGSGYSVSLRYYALLEADFTAIGPGVCLL